MVLNEGGGGNQKFSLEPFEASTSTEWFPEESISLEC